MWELPDRRIAGIRISGSSNPDSVPDPDPRSGRITRWTGTGDGKPKTTLPKAIMSSRKPITHIMGTAAKPSELM